MTDTAKSRKPLCLRISVFTNKFIDCKAWGNSSLSIDKFVMPELSPYMPDFPMLFYLSKDYLCTVPYEEAGNIDNMFFHLIKPEKQ